MIRRKKGKKDFRRGKKQFWLSAVSDVVSGNDKTEHEKIPCDGFDSEYNAKKTVIRVSNWEVVFTKCKYVAAFYFPAHFFRMAPLESVLGRDVKNCRINVEIRAGIKKNRGEKGYSMKNLIEE